MDKSICPFCGRKIVTTYFAKEGWWSCGCFNDKCTIRPKTRCFDMKEEAEQEWIHAFKENINMPVRKVKGGYKYGTKGKTYPTRKQAEKQGRAIRASQNKKNK